MSKKEFKIAVVGATGNVGEEMLDILHAHNFNPDNITAIASPRSAGKMINYGEDHQLEVQNLETVSFENIDIALFSPGAAVSEEYAPKAAAQGAIVIDNTSFFRMDPDIPLIVPEVNPHKIADYKNRNIIANPNCSTIQMLVALKPLHDVAKIKRIIVSTYQSVSGAGKEALDELFEQTRMVYGNQPLERNKFTKQIAFNCIPHIDKFMDDGSTKEEWKMSVETKKIFEDDSIEVVANCVRVPVFVGHGEAINVEFENDLPEEQAREILKQAQGIVLFDHRVDEGYVTQAECAGEDPVYVSRIRQDKSVYSGLSLWVVADNMRKGAALNAYQIAEILMKDYL